MQTDSGRGPPSGCHSRRRGAGCPRAKPVARGQWAAELGRPGHSRAVDAGLPYSFSSPMLSSALLSSPLLASPNSIWLSIYPCIHLSAFCCGCSENMPRCYTTCRHSIKSNACSEWGWESPAVPIRTAKGGLEVRV